MKKYNSEYEIMWDLINKYLSSLNPKEVVKICVIMWEDPCDDCTHWG